MNTDRLEQLMRAIRLLRKLSVSNREFAAGDLARFTGLWRKYLKKAERQERGANRLCLTLAKECGRIKAHYPQQVWGGELLGWTTQAEVDALDKSIATDY